MPQTLHGRRASTVAQEVAAELNRLVIDSAHDELDKSRRLRHKDFATSRPDEIYSQDELREYEREQKEQQREDGMSRLLASLSDRVKRRQPSLVSSHSSDKRDSRELPTVHTQASSQAAVSPFNKMLQLVTARNTTDTPPSPSATGSQPHTPLASRKSRGGSEVSFSPHTPTGAQSVLSSPGHGRGYTRMEWDQVSEAPSAAPHTPTRPHPVGSYGVVDVMSPARSQRSFCGLTNPMFDLPPSPANPTTPMGPRSLHNLQSSASRPTSVASHVRPTSVSAQHRVVMPQGSPQEPSALASPGFRPTSVSAQYRVAVPLAPSSDSALSSPGAARPVRVSAQHRTAMPLSTDAALASPGALGRSRGRRSSVDMFGLQDALASALGVMAMPTDTTTSQSTTLTTRGSVAFTDMSLSKSSPSFSAANRPKPGSMPFHPTDGGSGYDSGPSSQNGGVQRKGTGEFDPPKKPTQGRRAAQTQLQ